MGGPGSGRKKGSGKGNPNKQFNPMSGINRHSDIKKMKGLKKTKSGDFYDPKNSILFKSQGMGIYKPFKRRGTLAVHVRKYPNSAGQ